jgi:hypothetical protein
MHLSLSFFNKLSVSQKDKKGWEITKDRVSRVPGNLVLGCITDQAVFVGKGNIRRRHPVSLIVRYDFYSTILPCRHARVHRPQINPYRLAPSFVGHSRSQ